MPSVVWYGGICMVWCGWWGSCCSAWVLGMGSLDGVIDVSVSCDVAKMHACGTKANAEKAFPMPLCFLPCLSPVLWTIAALGTVYMPRIPQSPNSLRSRALATSFACMPTGMVASSLLEMAAWPAVGSACLVLGPALAAGVFPLHVRKDKASTLIGCPSAVL